MSCDMNQPMPDSDRLIFEKSKAGKQGFSLPERQHSGINLAALSGEGLRRNQAGNFPEVSEPELVRHFINLSKKNFSIDTHCYPLGSCTMKYNPKVNDAVAQLPGFSHLHPLQPAETIQGALQVMEEFSEMLCEITGMEAFTLQPAAGAHGELLGLMLVHAYHEKRGDKKRTKVLVPDSSHGTNPASAAMCGYQIVQIPSDARGRVTLSALKEQLGDDTACLMLTNPNTLGLFEDQILEVAELVHKQGALLYYDGANLNALLGIARPGDMGFDIVHVNLHKTFSTPHGGGGPGAGPVGVKKRLMDFLPVSTVEKTREGYRWARQCPDTVGRMKSFHGNFGVLLRAYVYLKMLGAGGIRQVSEDAILNANYLRKKVASIFEIPFPQYCMHEFVASTRRHKDLGIHAGDIGKRLLDYGIHAPTVHFPLVVEEALMFEPTETESKETLDRLAEVLTAIRKEMEHDPKHVAQAPHRMPIKRVDDVLAARKPILSWRDYQAQKPVLAAV